MNLNRRLRRYLTDQSSGVLTGIFRAKNEFTPGVLNVLLMWGGARSRLRAIGFPGTRDDSNRTSV